MTDIDLFRAFNVRLPSGRNLWNIKQRRDGERAEYNGADAEASVRRANVERYRQRAEAGLPIFE